MKLTDNAIKVLEKRYLLKNEAGEIVETPLEMFQRVARRISDAAEESKRQPLYYTFLGMLGGLDFLPNSPTLMNAGKERGMLSACFVLPVEDSMESIFDAVRNTAIIHKDGGGTGFDFSRLRPKGDVVHSTSGVSSGPVSFMEVFNASTEVIKQGGKRRGANLGVLRIDHPDILEFIAAKRDTGRLTNFNVSVGITDQFMEALLGDRDFALISPRTGGTARAYKASYLWDEIVASAHATGEPGILFLDTMNRANPTPQLGNYATSNPCGEVPLLHYEACNLGSINLANFVMHDPVSPSEVNWNKLRAVTEYAVEFLDLVIDANVYPLPEIAAMARGNRKIGLGVMGWADMLIALGIPYDSEEALSLAEHVMEFIEVAGHAKSRQLAHDRGAYPNQTLSLEGQVISRRNATVTTIAPTGTISMIASCSSGIEPLFAVSYEKHVLDGATLPYAHPAFVGIAEARGFYSSDLMARIAERGSVRGMDEVPEDVQRIFATALDIAPEWHVKMQAAFQRHVDNAVSKCVAEGTLTLSEHGIVPIEALSSTRGTDVTTPLKTVMAGESKPVETSYFYSGGERDTLKIITKEHTSLQGTPNHRIRVEVDGNIVWKRLDEICLHDNVVIRYGQRLFPTVNKVTCDMARLLGHLVADDSLLTNTITTTHTIEEVTADRAKMLAIPEITHAAVTGIRNTRNSERPVKITRDPRNRNIAISRNGRGIVRYLESLGLKRGARNKCVPDVVMQSSFEVQREFLRGLFTDCGIAQRKTANLAFSTASALLARQVRFMLLNLGIYTTHTINHKSGWDYHRLYFPVHEAFKFADIVGFIETERNLQFDSFRKNEDEHAVIGSYHRLGSLFTKRNGYYVEAVVDIEKGSAEVFDVSVPDGNAFITEGIVSHNTINFPASATVEDVDRAFRLAWKKGCKGLTVYRYGSRDAQVLTVGGAKAPEAAAKRATRTRPEVTHGCTSKVATGCGNLYITLNRDEAGPCEVFATMGKAGGCAASQLEAIGRLVSLALRFGVNPKDITKNLCGIRCPYPAFCGAGQTLSCADAIGRIVEVEVVSAAEPTGEVARRASGACPDCGETLVASGGCATCTACGYSRCG